MKAGVGERESEKEKHNRSRVGSNGAAGFVSGRGREPRSVGSGV